MTQEQRIEYFMSEIARLSNQVVDLQNERDALAAELVALSAFRDEVVGVMNHSEGVWGWHKNHTVATWDELLPVVPDFESPQQHLAEIKAQAAYSAYVHCLNSWSTAIKPSAYAGLAKDYADSILKDEVK